MIRRRFSDIDDISDESSIESETTPDVDEFM
jgi:hypothetical protein